MAEYTFDVQKLYLEMLLADAESFARAQNIFNPNSFDRKLQPVAKFIKDYMEEYKVMPDVDQVKKAQLEKERNELVNNEDAPKLIENEEIKVIKTTQ